MLSADIGQFLKPVFLCQIGARAIHGLIVPILGAEAALWVMPCQLIQLADKSLECLVLNVHCHMPYIKLLIDHSKFRWAQLTI